MTNIIDVGRNFSTVAVPLSAEIQHASQSSSMASPLAHSFAGFWTFLYFCNDGGLSILMRCRGLAFQLIVLVFVANFADLDFLLSLYFRGDLNTLHHGFTHSILIAVGVSFVFAAIFPFGRPFWRNSLVYLTAYGSHLLIDLVTASHLGWNISGSGIPLLWPSAQEWRSPVALFVGVQHKNLEALWGIENAISSLFELLVCGGITGILLAAQLRYEQNS